MTDDRERDTPRSRAYSNFSWCFPLFAGLLPALLVFALVHFLLGMDQEQRARQETLRSLETATAAINTIWERNASLAGNVARNLHGSNAAQIQAVLAPYRVSWPGTAFSVYAPRGNPLAHARSASGPDVDPVSHTVRNLVQKGLSGQSAMGFTRVRGFMALSVGVPIRNSDAGVLVVAVPLDTLALNELKEAVRADIALLPLKDFKSEEFTPLPNAASTFSSSEGEAARMDKALAPFLNGSLAETTLFNFGRRGIPAAITPLNGPDGVMAGALVVAPLDAPPASSPLLPVASALTAGLIGFAVTIWGMRRRSERLAALIARAVDDFGRNPHTRRGKVWKDTGCPVPVAESLDRLAVTFGERRKGTDRRQRPRTDADSGSVTAGSGGSASFLRLFDNVPVGVFQTNGDGRFIRINPAFALMLGYDSAELLLEHCPGFADFFLYADGLLNPLSAMARQPGVNHSVSLRRRDGKVGHFSLTFSLLPSASGDPSDTIEGFLVDREAEEITAQSERDRDCARSQRASLALLLAATCRRRSRDCPDPAGDGGSMEPDGPNPSERRAGVIAADSALNDIYQIAMTEAEFSPPVFMPLEFEPFFRSLGNQVLYAMRAKGISLRFEVSRALPEHLSGPVPILRHALKRALLAVTDPVQGGWAEVSLMRDPNAPQSHGMARVLFSVTWSRFPQESQSASARLEEQPASGDYITLFELPPESGESGQALPGNAGTLEIAEELEILLYMVQKMHGDMPAPVFTSDLRSLRMIITLPWNTADEKADISHAAPEAHARWDPVVESPAADSLTFASEEKGLAPTLPLDASSLELPDIDGPEESTVYEDQENENDAPPAGEALDILLVDDSLNNRLLFSLFLHNTRHRITEAHDGQQGVEAFRHGHFDVIFLNMEMPLMDGYQATRIIRALEADAGEEPTPIVAMTTYALPVFRRQCMLAGCSDFLSKPFTKNAVLSLLDAFAQLKRGGTGESAPLRASHE